VSFEDRTLTGTGLVAPYVVRKVGLKSLAPEPLELHSVTMAEGRGVDVTEHPVLGIPGCLIPQASASFVLPKMDRAPPPNARLVVRFVRQECIASFFPWKKCRSMLPAGSWPPAVATSGLPEEPVTKAESGLGGFHVSLEHPNTGSVAEPMQVNIWVRRPIHEPHTISMQLLLDDGALDRCLIHGVVDWQLHCDASEVDDSQVCGKFVLVPLQLGWLPIPRVHFSCDHVEATSSPSFAFICSGAAHSVLWRKAL